MLRPIAVKAAEVLVVGGGVAHCSNGTEKKDNFRISHFKETYS